MNSFHGFVFWCNSQVWMLFFSITNILRFILGKSSTGFLSGLLVVRRVGNDYSKDYVHPLWQLTPWVHVGLDFNFKGGQTSLWNAKPGWNPIKWVNPPVHKMELLSVDDTYSITCQTICKIWLKSMSCINAFAILNPHKNLNHKINVCKITSQHVSIAIILPNR